MLHFSRAFSVQFSLIGIRLFSKESISFFISMSSDLHSPPPSSPSTKSHGSVFPNWLRSGSGRKKSDDPSAHKSLTTMESKELGPSTPQMQKRSLDSRPTSRAAEEGQLQSPGPTKHKRLAVLTGEEDMSHPPPLQQPKSRFRNGHASFRLRMLQEQHGSGFEPDKLPQSVPTSPAGRGNQDPFEGILSSSTKRSKLTKSTKTVVSSPPPTPNANLSVDAVEQIKHQIYRMRSLSGEPRGSSMEDSLLPVTTTTGPMEHRASAPPSSSPTLRNLRTFRMAHESFRARMFHEQHNVRPFEPVGGDLNKYTARSYAIQNGNEVFGVTPSHSASFLFFHSLHRLVVVFHQNFLIVNDRKKGEREESSVFFPSSLGIVPTILFFRPSVSSSLRLAQSIRPRLSIEMIAKQTRRQAPVRILKHQPGLDFKAQQIFHAKRGRKLSIADFSI
ncbi:hypothetical protein PRIPAC_72443, partial [Pristionchus pacificus]|uniref:Uncharacterized protein n=1 Tax=Pristionchus pacificus TaxID=54126 RepID=A0A2A6CZH4_PRIPA